MIQHDGRGEATQLSRKRGRTRLPSPSRLASVTLAAVGAASCSSPWPRCGRTTDLLLACRSATATASDADAPVLSPGAELGRMSCDGVPRTSICLAPRAMAEVSVEILPDAVLHTEAGIDRAAHFRGAMALAVEIESGGATATLWRGRVPPGRGWVPIRADLSAHAGRRVRLRFRAGAAPEGARHRGGFAAPQIRSPGRPCRPPEVAPGSATLLSLDTLRVDHLGAFGDPRPLTPGLDAILRQCELYPDAMAPSHWTLPSHAGMFTGTYPDVNGTAQGHAIPAELPVLAEILRAAGTHTAAFVTDLGWLGPRFGLDRGFDVFLATNEPSGQRIRRVREHLESRPGGRVFLFVHLFDAHSDPRTTAYEASPGSMALTGARSGPHGGCRGHGCANRDLAARSASGTPLPPHLADDLAAAYAAGVADLDLEVARLLRELRDIGLLERSLLVIASDHGEHLGERGRFLHEHVAMETTRALLAIRRPGAGGELREGMASLVDVAPSILEHAGVPVPPTFQGQPLGERAREWAYVVGRNSVALRTRDRSLRRDAGGTAWYDMARDPGETVPLTGDGGLAPVLDELASDHARRRLELDASTVPTHDPDDAAELRALGYLE